MQNSLKPYPEYKESGVPWLGKIPEHWECLPHRAVFSEVKEQNHINEQLLSVTIAKGIIPQSNLLASTSKKDSSNIDKSKYKLVCPKDIAYNKMRAWQGAIGVSKHRGIVSPAYVVVRLRNHHNPNYFHYLFRTPLFIKEAERWSYGITPDMWSLRPEHFKVIYTCLPKDDEQTQIARFLDWKNAQINRFIRNKRRLIEVLKEQKQSIINQAVTRGLDPKVKLKPSGLEWIGDMPEHWEVAPLKHLASINARVLSESTDQNYTFKYFDISSVGTGCLSGEPETLRFGQAPSRARRILKKGDTILSTVRTYLKAVYYVSDEVEDWIASTGFAALTPKKAIYPPFLGLVIQSDNFINRVIRESIGVAYPAIAETKLGTLHLAYPESIEEQQLILEHVANSSKVIDQAISRAEREIALMREYRTRLIADVVTGQVDVRGIEVPEIAEDELLALDDDSADDVIDETTENEETEVEE